MRTAPARSSVGAMVPTNTNRSGDSAFDVFLTEDLEPTCCRLRSLLREKRDRDLEAFISIGRIVAKDYEALIKRLRDSTTTKPITKFCAQLERSLDIPESVLYSAYRVVKTYGKANLERLVNSPPITAGHLRQLVAVSDPALRRELEDKIVAEELTVKELVHCVKSAVKPQRKPGGGRPVKIPANAQAGIRHLLESTKAYIKLHEEAWFGSQFDMPRAIMEIPSDKLNEDFRSSVAEAAEALRRVQEVAGEHARTLCESVVSVEERIEDSRKQKEEWRRQHRTAK